MQLRFFQRPRRQLLFDNTHCWHEGWQWKFLFWKNRSNHLFMRWIMTYTSLHCRFSYSARKNEEVLTFSVKKCSKLPSLDLAASTAIWRCVFQNLSGWNFRTFGPARMGPVGREFEWEESSIRYIKMVIRPRRLSNMTRNCIRILTILHWHSENNSKMWTSFGQSLKRPWQLVDFTISGLSYLLVLIFRRFIGHCSYCWPLIIESCVNLQGLIAQFMP